MVWEDPPAADDLLVFWAIRTVLRESRIASSTQERLMRPTMMKGNAPAVGTTFATETMSAMSEEGSSPVFKLFQFFPFFNTSSPSFSRLGDLPSWRASQVPNRVSEKAQSRFLHRSTLCACVLPLRRAIRRKTTCSKARPSSPHEKTVPKCHRTSKLKCMFSLASKATFALLFHLPPFTLKSSSFSGLWRVWMARLAHWTLPQQLYLLPVLGK